MNILCDLCASDRLEKVYTPPTTQRGLAVYVCNECGLLQSIPRISHVEKGEPSISSGADFGNIRYGKSFSVDSAMVLLSEYVDWDKIHNILEVGAGRGEFIRALREHTGASIVAIEPNVELVDYEVEHMAVDRFEDIDLAGKYDLIILNHVLEHLPSPFEALTKIYNALNGYLYIQVPNVAGILEQNLVEEWFIDKHLYHFSEDTLKKYLIGLGFCADEFIEDENLTVVAHKCREYRRAEINEYTTKLDNNSKLLKVIARIINRMDEVVIWGAGRIFDALVNAGLDAGGLTAVVDKHLGDYKPIVYNRKIFKPEQLNYCPEKVVICSREYAEEIRVEAKELWPRADIKIWSEL